MKVLNLLGGSLLALGLACGGGGSNGPSGSSSFPKLTVILGSNSDPELTQAVMGVEKVEISADGANWTSLGTPKATYDLMALQGGHEATLINEAPVAAGTYIFRITWATTNYADGTRLAAYVEPAGMGLIMPTTTTFSGSVTLPSSGSSTARLSLDPSTSILKLQGATTTFVLTSAGAATDTAGLATITGTLRSGGTLLAGAEVLAEVVDGLGMPRILQRVFCDNAGKYVLNALPTNLGGLPPIIYVVAMPSNGAQAFPARCAGSFPMTTPGSVTTGVDMDFSGLGASASIALTVTPRTPTGALTVADLRQTLTFGTSSQYLIVRSHATTIGVSQDTYAFNGLGGGNYGVVATRGTAVVTTPSQILLNPGQATALTLTLP